jgi:hypothetical protein
MNLALADPTEADFPSSLEVSVDLGMATCCAFNRKGTILMVGIATGDVVLYVTLPPQCRLISFATCFPTLVLTVAFSLWPQL